MWPGVGVDSMKTDGSWSSQQIQRDMDGMTISATALWRYQGPGVINFLIMAGGKRLEEILFKPLGLHYFILLLQDVVKVSEMELVSHVW